MNPQEPVIPDPDPPVQTPGDTVDDPPANDGRDSYSVTKDGQYLDITSE